MQDAYFRTVKEVLEYFQTDPRKGLTQVQIQKNKEKYGKNELPPPDKTSWFELIKEQFEDLLVLILVVSAIISFILGLLEEKSSFTEACIEPCIIILILVANAIVGIWQESNAEEAIERLKEYEAKEATVIRDGHEKKIDRNELVPGDLVKLVVGERIPADCRLIEINSRTFRTNESMLTGEPHEKLKVLEAIVNPNDGKEVVDQAKKNILFSGTLVVHGVAKGIVVLTGTKTSMGNIHTGLMKKEETKTPLEEKLEEFAELLSKLILGICVVVWLINLSHFAEHGSWFFGAVYYFKIAVALAVAAIPEGLPAVVTTCLALGAMKMAKRQAIVRSLPSVETLGCTTVICSDKTGTLTTNQMSVRHVVTINNTSNNGVDVAHYSVAGTTFEPKGDITEKISSHSHATGNQHTIEKTTPSQEHILHLPTSRPSLKWMSKISSLCNDSSLSYEIKNNLVHWKIRGEPTEGALKVLAAKLKSPDHETAYDSTQHDVKETHNIVETYWKERFDRIHLLEFTRERKSMSVFVKDHHNHHYLLVKGAPESILSRSTYVFCGAPEDDDEKGATTKITPDIKTEIHNLVSEYSKQGLRCLAMAYKEYGTNTLELNEQSDYSAIESDLTFVGIVGMLDPPRAEVSEAIRLCRTAGIRVIVITGDNKATAEAICREIGLFDQDEDLQGKSYEGSTFMSLTKEQQNQEIKKASLFSRVMPSHKLELVTLLQSQNEVVAMTGDGVNDAQALAKSNIGIAMGSGTEVARHSSHMVLADDNFATIVSAVEEGRAIYQNTKQFIRYLISSNIGEVACIFLTAAFGIPEALIPVQLLWVNLVTDGLPATALGFNKADKDIMQQSPRGKTDPIINGWMLFRYIIIGTYVGVSTVFGFIWWYTMFEQGPMITFSQLTHFHSCNLNNESQQTYFNKKVFSHDCSIFHDPRPSTISLSILVTIEMFNTFNAISENQSLLSTPPWANLYVVAAVTTSMILHSFILYIPFLAKIFSTAPLNAKEWLAVVVFSFPVIIIDETLKWISRRQNVHKITGAKKTT